MRNDSVALAERARAPDARAHYTAQLVALRREQGRLDELLPELERFARDASTVGPWHAILPLAYLDAGDRARARAAYDAALAGGVSAVPRTMFWLASLASLAEAAALLEDARTAQRISTPRSSRTPTSSRSGASPATRDPSTACWAGRRPPPNSATARASTSRTLCADTPRLAADRCSPAPGATTASCS